MKAESRTQEGTYLGIHNQTSESLIAIEDGITSARTVRRMPADSGWNKDAVLDVKVQLQLMESGELSQQPHTIFQVVAIWSSTVMLMRQMIFLHKTALICNLSMTQLHQVNQLFLSFGDKDRTTHGSMQV